jgi:hypothetical protein
VRQKKEERRIAQGKAVFGSKGMKAAATARASAAAPALRCFDCRFSAYAGQLPASEIGTLSFTGLVWAKSRGEAQQIVDKYAKDKFQNGYTFENQMALKEDDFMEYLPPCTIGAEHQDGEVQLLTFNDGDDDDYFIRYGHKPYFRCKEHVLAKLAEAGKEVFEHLAHDGAAEGDRPLIDAFIADSAEKASRKRQRDWDYNFYKEHGGGPEDEEGTKTEAKRSCSSIHGRRRRRRRRP